MNSRTFRTWIRVALLAFLFVSAGAASAADLGVRLSLTPVETFPGVPVTVELTITNSTAKGIAVSRQIAFAISSADASDKKVVSIPVQYWYGEIDAVSKSVIPAGSEVRWFMPLTADLGSPLFDGTPLNTPGEYDIVATVKGANSTSADSNRIHLTVSTPLGVDATAWKAVGGDEARFTSADIKANCATILGYPQSRYYQLVSRFCVPFTSLSQYSHDVLAGLTALPPAFQDASRLAVAWQYLHEAETAYGRNKLALAGTISDAGRPVAQDLIDNPATDFGQVAGAWMKRELLTEAGWRSRFSAGHGPKRTLNVSPAVTCVSETGSGTFVAQFGFNNPNNFDVKVPIGSDNHVSPGLDNQGQPVEFEPGSKESVFTVKGLTAPLKWTLQGKTAKASLDESPKCSDVQPPDPEQ